MTVWPTRTGLDVFDRIDSTNEEARRRVAEGMAVPFWIAAKRQTMGRGRQGRRWTSEPGNLAATGVFSIDGSPAEAALLSFTAALAVADTLTALAPEAEVAMKWPNDALLNGGKVSGILLESLSADGPAGLVLAIGIGINLEHHPDPQDTNWRPTSIKSETGRAPDFDFALLILADSMQTWLDVHRRLGFAEIRRHWLARASNLGKEIRVRLGQETLHGRFRDLDSDGALVLEGPSGTRRISAGDVFLPGDT
ncbi:MAG: biotin--[acetyl-CoA-carboxylase] ligase [Pseudomonadota bacterium]